MSQRPMKLGNGPQADIRFGQRGPAPGPMPRGPWQNQMGQGIGGQVGQQMGQNFGSQPMQGMPRAPFNPQQMQAMPRPTPQTLPQIWQGNARAPQQGNLVGQVSPQVQQMMGMGSRLPMPSRGPAPKGAPQGLLSKPPSLY